MTTKNESGQINENDLREFKKELKRKSKNELIYIVTAMVIEKLMGRQEEEQPKEGQ